MDVRRRWAPCLRASSPPVAETMMKLEMNDGDPPRRTLNWQHQDTVHSELDTSLLITECAGRKRDEDMACGLCPRGDVHRVCTSVEGPEAQPDRHGLWNCLVRDRRKSGANTRR